MSGRDFAQSPEIGRRCLRFDIAEESLLVGERPRSSHILSHKDGRREAQIVGQMFKHEARTGAPVVSQHQSPLQLPCQRSKRIAVDRVASLLQMNS